jgi:predicted RNA methylase
MTAESYSPYELIALQGKLTKYIMSIKEAFQHPEDFAILDLGAGCGRMIILYVNWGFKVIHGLEPQPAFV